MDKNEGDWMSELIEFYDFVWNSGVELCGEHVNGALIEDFAKGGTLFEKMKEKILEKYPTEIDARKAFSLNQVINVKGN